MFNSLLAIFFWKACTFSSFERFLCWKSRNYSQIYLCRIINYWDSILTLYITWGTFSLVCFLSVFFFLSLSLSSFFLFFYRYFPWQTLTIPKIGETGEGIIIFLVFHFHPLTNIHLTHRNFYHLFLRDLSVITRLMRLALLRYLDFICIFMDGIKSELLTLTFQSDCEYLSSYQTITLLLQSERLKKLRFVTTVYLSYQPSPNPSRNLPTNRFPKCIRNKECFIFFTRDWNRTWYFYLYLYLYP